MALQRSDLAQRFTTAARCQWLGLLPLGGGLAGLTPNGLLPLLTIGLGALTLLKLVEARTLEERRLVALLQLLGTGLLAAQLPALGPSLLQLAGAGLALAGLLALELGSGLDWRVLLRRSLQVLTAGLPLALVLFLLVPRLEPFATLPLNGGAAATTGLSDQLDPGSIASLVSSDGPAARVSLPAGLPPPEQRYWRVLVHDHFAFARADDAADEVAHGDRGIPPAFFPGSDPSCGPCVGELVHGVHCSAWHGTQGVANHVSRVRQDRKLFAPDQQRVVHLVQS